MARSYSGVTPFLISLVTYVTLGPLLILILLINEFVRLIVSLYLEIKFGGEVWLVPDGNDGVYTTHNPGRSPTVLIMVRFNGKIDREALETVYHERIRPDLDSKGNRAYRKLEYLLIREAGYPCWKMDGDFNIRNHIRVMGDNKQYNKEDLQKLCKELSEDDMEPSRPQWEFVIVPRYKEPGEKEVTGYFIIRFNHGYMDGLSFGMLMKRTLFSNYNYYLDPLTFKIPSWKRYLSYLNAIQYGPNTLLALVMDRSKSVYWPVCLPTSEVEKVERNYAWACDISLETIQKIIKATTTDNHKGSIPSLVQIAFISAAIQVLPKERIPNEWVIAEVAALLPYQDHQLQNRFTFSIYSINSNKKDDHDFAKLKELGRSAREGSTGPFVPLFYYLVYILGRMPCVLHPALLLDGAFSTSILSNVPISKTKVRFFNNAEIMEMIGFPPVANGTGIIIASSFYFNNLKVSAVAKSSWIRQDELEEIVGRIPAVIQKWAVLADKMILK